MGLQRQKSPDSVGGGYAGQNRGAPRRMVDVDGHRAETLAHFELRATRVTGNRAMQILLGVTGGIAAYKSPDLVRRLRERGAEVQVVMTAGAQHFVTPFSFQAVSGRPARGELWDLQAEAAMGHIELARWADRVLVAPASADFLARLAAGLADDLLTTLCLATEAPISVAPAMNSVMWANPATQANIAILRSRDVDVLGPADGSQACGEFGVGRMLEPDHLAEQVLGARGTGPDLAGVHVTITAGPTRERIDPVRFISNRSSGKMGFAVARAAAEAGARVCLISGPVHLPTPPGVSRIDVESAEDMYQSVLGTLEDAQILIAAAAVSDYRPHAASDRKIKKGSGGLQLELDQATDILAVVAAREDAPFTVGFAAETHDVEAHAAEKMERKKLDMIAANRVGDGLGFDTRTNELTVLWPGGRKVLPECHKLTLARELVRLIAERYRQCRGGGA